MADLTIPDNHEKAFVKLFKMSDKSFNDLVLALQQVKPKVFSSDVAADVALKARNVPASDIVEILEALMSLFYSASHHDVSPTDIAGDVVEALRESGNPEIQFTPDKVNWFKERLTRILKLETLLVVSKAVGILQSNENNFYSVQVVTDIRPVFGSQPNKSPIAAGVIHLLNFTYYQSGVMKEFFIALDSAEIEVLRDALDRADLKTEVLKSLIEKANITYLDPTS